MRVLLSRLSPLGRLGGVDVGTKTYGLAVATLDPLIVTPAHTIYKSKYAHDLALLRKFARERNIEAWIFGLPLNMDGSSGARVQATKTIARNIARDTGLPYAFQDERLSSFHAGAALMETGMKAAKRKNVIDAHAAAVILENYMADR